MMTDLLATDAFPRAFGFVVLRDALATVEVPPPRSPEPQEPGARGEDG
jgi:hypothetical protein